MFAPKKKKKPPRTVVSQPRFLFSGAALRALLLGVFAVVFAAYALVRAYTRPRPPMVVPVQPAPTSSEIPAPELEIIDP